MIMAGRTRLWMLVAGCVAVESHQQRSIGFLGPRNHSVKSALCTGVSPEPFLLLLLLQVYPSIHPRMLLTPQCQSGGLSGQLLAAVHPGQAAAPGGCLAAPAAASVMAAAASPRPRPLVSCPHRRRCCR
jgi:hypothetical protein